MSIPPDEQSGEGTAPDFDATRLKILLDMEDEGDTTMIRDIAKQFVQDITGVLSKIDTAINTKDYRQVAAGAHTVKGSAATFGLFRVEKIARQLEASAKDAAKNEAVPSLYESLKESFAKGSAALEAYFEAK